MLNGVITSSRHEQRDISAAIQQRYLSLNQAACYLGLSPKTLYLWAEDKKIPYYKLGRLWRFDREELDGFVRGINQKTLIQSPPSENAVGSERNGGQNANPT